MCMMISPSSIYLTNGGPREKQRAQELLTESLEVCSLLSQHPHGLQGTCLADPYPDHCHCLLDIHWALVSTIAYLDGNSRQGKYHKINVGHLKFQRTLSRQNNIILEFLYYFNHFN